MTSEEKVVVFIAGIVAKEVTATEAMDWIWSEENTEEHPVHIYSRDGREIEW